MRTKTPFPPNWVEGADKNKTVLWSPFEKVLISAADELHRDAFITNDTWNKLMEKYSEEQIVDLVATVGNYNLVCMILNTLGVQLEPDFPGFPEL